jgi:electron transport complex protein RnfC
METLKTFRKGGVHPAENKLSAGVPIRILSLPDQVYIPISQHLGAPAEVKVDKGDGVKTGQLIASLHGFVSANIHSSVSGKVQKIDLTPDSSGYKRTTIVIKVEGDEWVDSIDRSPEINPVITASPEEIRKKITEGGIVGLGGATFPSHVKLSLPRGKEAQTLIINGVECEPYLTSDHRLMLEKGPEIVIGIKLLMKVLGAKQGMIGIENNKPDAINRFKQILADEPRISVNALKVKYPQGGEKQLIKALINREVPARGLPIDVGAIVHNVGTAFAVYEAVQKNKPLIERVVTVTGYALPNPSNYLVRIGTPVSKLIEAVGGLPKDTGKIISGGPMMGKALSNTDVPVVKGTTGILLLPDRESRRKKILPCIRCAKCISACPQGLEPYLLMAMMQKEMLDELEMNNIMDCSECGSCSYICPSNRPLLDYIRLGKTTVGKIISKRKN